MYGCTYEYSCGTVVQKYFTFLSCCFVDHVSSSKHIESFGYSCVSFVSLFINLRHPPDFTSHTSRRGTLYNEVKSFFFDRRAVFTTAWQGRSRRRSAPWTEIARGPPVTSLALALAPWPAQRPLKDEKVESVSRDTPPYPRCRAVYVKPAL